MRTISFPKCPAEVPIPVDEADSRGRVRLICGACGTRLLIKVNPRVLKLSPDIPLSSTNPEFVPGREYSGMWALLVNDLRDHQQSPFRRALLSMPRLRGNPNKLHDATAELPYVFHGLKRGEAVFLDEELSKLGAEFESGPQEWLLDESMMPIADDMRGPRPRVEEDDDADVQVLSAVPGSSWEIRYDGGRPSRSDLSVSAELALSSTSLSRFSTHPSLPPAPRPVTSPGAPPPARRPRAATTTPSEYAEDRSPFDQRTPAPSDEMPPLASNDDYLWQRPEPTPELPGVAIEVMSSHAGDLDLGDLGSSNDLSAVAEEASRLAASIAPPVFQPIPTPPPAPAPPPVALRPEPEPAYDDAFAIVSINELPGRKFHIGALHTTISVSANELDVGSQTAIDVALDQAHALLQQRAEELGGTGIVGLRVTQSAIPTRAGWMLVLVVSGTAVA